MPCGRQSVNASQEEREAATCEWILSSEFQCRVYGHTWQMMSTRHPGATEEDIERSVEAPLAVLVVVLLQIMLAAVSLSKGWVLWKLPGWVWLVPIVPEVMLVAALVVHNRTGKAIIGGRRRTASLALVGIVAAANFLALAMLIGSLLSAEAHSGAELLLKGLTIWGTNVITFGLFYWEMDAGGPDARIKSDWDTAGPGFEQRDFQFPQMENPQLAAAGKGWRPHLVDYIFLSYTNSIAFSPTDAMPLRHRAKILMMVEASVSAVTVLLVAARAVNILH